MLRSVLSIIAAVLTLSIMRIIRGLSQKKSTILSTVGSLLELMVC